MFESWNVLIPSTCQEFCWNFASIHLDLPEQSLDLFRASPRVQKIRVQKNWFWDYAKNYWEVKKPPKPTVPKNLIPKLLLPTYHTTWIHHTNHPCLLKCISAFFFPTELPWLLELHLYRVLGARLAQELDAFGETNFLSWLLWCLRMSHVPWVSSRLSGSDACRGWPPRPPARWGVSLVWERRGLRCW